MKIRQGFVSNSSSSSFTIGCKGELTTEKLLELFKVPSDSPIYPVVKDIANCMVKNATLTTLKEYADDYSDEELLKYFIKNEMNVYHGYASDDNGGVENMVCDLDMQYKSDDFYIEKDGGY